jgi:hypothetical protein
MPNIKPKTCHKCGQMYIGWRCPHCYRKSARSASGSRYALRHTFNASSVLSYATLDFSPTAPFVEYGEARICRHCGFLTTTRNCSYCGKE